MTLTCTVSLQCPNKIESNKQQTDVLIDYANITNEQYQTIYTRIRCQILGLSANPIYTVQFHPFIENIQYTLTLTLVRIDIVPALSTHKRFILFIFFVRVRGRDRQFLNDHNLRIQVHLTKLKAQRL